MGVLFPETERSEGAQESGWGGKTMGSGGGLQGD